MSAAGLLAPALVEVVLIYLLLFALILARRRTGAGATKLRAGQIADSFRNQFEMPVLFFAAVAIALATRGTDMTFVVLAWIFVGLRVAHAAEHVTANRPRWRGLFFAAGAATLGFVWIDLALGLASAQG